MFNLAFNIYILYFLNGKGLLHAESHNLRNTLLDTYQSDFFSLPFFF